MSPRTVQMIEAGPSGRISYDEIGAVASLPSSTLYQTTMTVSLWQFRSWACSPEKVEECRNTVVFLLSWCTALGA